MEGRTESVFSGARLPPSFFNDMMTSFNISSVVDMTPGQGPLLQTCLDLRVPALAICLSDTHCEQLEERLTTLFAKIRGPLPHLHRPEASKFLTKNGEWKEEEDQKKEEKH